MKTRVTVFIRACKDGKEWDIDHANTYTRQELLDEARNIDYIDNINISEDELIQAYTNNNEKIVKSYTYI